MATIDIILYAIAGVLILSAALLGFIRGGMRALVRLITIVISAVASYALIFCGMSAFSAKFPHGMTFGQLLSNAGQSGLIAKYLPAEYAAVIESMEAEGAVPLLSVPATLVVFPILAIVIFVLISAVMLILHKIICLIAHFSRSNNGFVSRLIGFLIGAAQGAVVSFIFLLPVAGVGNLAGEVAGVLNNDAPDSQMTATVNVYKDDYIDPINRNPVIKTVYMAGGEMLYDKLAVFDFSGDEINAKSEIMMFAEIYAEYLANFEGTDMRNLTEEQTAVLDGMVEKASQSDSLTYFLSALVRSVSDCREAGTFKLSEQVERDFGPIIDEVVAVFGDSTSESIKEDIKTIGDVYSLMAKEGILSLSGDPLEQALSNEEFVSQIVQLLYANERTRGLGALFARYGMAIVCQNLGIPNDAEDAYEALLADVAALMNKESSTESEAERVNEISDGLAQIFDLNGITMDEDKRKLMAECLYTDFGSADTVTADDIESFFIMMYTVYDKGSSASPAAYGGSGNAFAYDGARMFAEAMKALDENGEAVIESPLGNTYYLSGKGCFEEIENLSGANGGFKTARALMSDLLSGIDKGYEKLSSENIKAEADNMAAMISSFIEVLDMLGSSTNINDLDTTVMERFFNSIDNSIVFGINDDGRSEIKAALLESATVRSDMLAFDRETIEKISGGEVSLMSVIKAAAAVAGMVETITSDGKTDITAVEEDVRELIDCVDSGTVEVIKEIMTDKVISDNSGADDNISNAVSDTMTAVLDEMVIISETADEETKTREATAVSKFFSVIITAADGKEASDVFGDEDTDGNGSVTAEEFMRNSFESSVISGALKNIATDTGGDGSATVKNDPLGIADSVTEENKTIIAQEIDKYIADPANNADLATADAIRAIFGIYA